MIDVKFKNYTKVNIICTTMAITDDAEMMTYGWDRNTLTHTYLRTLCFVTDLHYWSTSWLQRR